MACFDPRPAFSFSKTALGKDKWCFSKRLDDSQPLPPDSPHCKWQWLPCGKCAGCRLQQSRDWTVRNLHEATLHKYSSFITLTYRDADLPGHGQLYKPHLSKFMKDMRALLCSRSPKAVSRRKGRGLCYVPKIRFFGCGEYGEQFSRPHYHAIIFGYDFPDKVKLFSKKGTTHFRSPVLESLWPHGQCTVGAVTPNSVSYVSGYVFKKRVGPSAESHYEFLDEYGEYRQRVPEFSLMSRRPGIAKSWFDSFARSDVYSKDFVSVSGLEFRPPKYYDRQYELVDPSDLVRIKAQRKAKALEFEAENTYERRQVKKKLCELNILKRERSFEK